MATEQARLDRGRQYNTDASKSHTKTVFTVSRMRREQQSLTATLAAADKLRVAMTAAVIAGTDFHRVFGQLNGVVASSADHLEHHRGRLTDMIDMMKEQNRQMHTLTTCLNEQFVKPLKITAEGWKVRNSALDSQIKKYSKENTKKSATLLKTAFKCRDARDTALGQSSNSQKTIKASTKLNEVLTQYDQYFQTHSQMEESFCQEAVKEEVSRYDSVLSASTMLAQALGGMSAQAKEFKSWLAAGGKGGVTQETGEFGDIYIDVDGDEEEAAAGYKEARAPVYNPEAGIVFPSRSVNSQGLEFQSGKSEPNDDGPVREDSPQGIAQGDDSHRVEPIYQRSIGIVQADDVYQNAIGMSQIDLLQEAYPGDDIYQNAIIAGGGRGDAAPAPAPAPVAARRRRSIELEPPKRTPNAVAIYPYVKELPDELSLEPGQALEILEESDDGWVNAIAIDTGEEGWFHTSFAQRDDAAMYVETVRAFVPDDTVENALGFDKGERIRILKQASEAWWLGMLLDGPPHVGFVQVTHVTEPTSVLMPKFQEDTDTPKAPTRTKKKKNGNELAGLAKVSNGGWSQAAAGQRRSSIRPTTSTSGRTKRTDDSEC